ncbi:DgyrCDS13932 [Dimorphilus gyrociliatus]|nr:DgyrCDS13932 [Dimorphilus gyrociliatus]
MRGASMPFQFRSFIPEELVQVEDDTGLLIVKKRTNVLEEQLSKVMKEKEVIYNQLEETRQQNFQNEKKIIELEGEITHIETELESQTKLLRGERDALEENLDKCRQSLKEKTVALDLALTVEEELKNQVAVLERELGMISKKEIEMLRQTDKVQGENKNLNEKIELLDSALAERSQKEECYMKRFTEMKTMLGNLEVKHSALQKTYDDTLIRLKGEIAISKHYKDDISTLSERLTNYEDKLSAGEESKSIMRKELSSIKEFNAKLNQKFEHSTSENANLKMRLSELETLLQDQSKETNRAVEEEREKYRSIKSLYDKLKTESKDMVADGSRMALQTAYDEVRSRFSKFQKENVDLKRLLTDIENLNKDYEQREEHLMKENEDLKRRLQMAGEEYRTKYVECMKLQKQCTKLERKADLTDSMIKGNVGSNDVTCEAYVCSSDSVCQTNEAEVHEIELHNKIKELLQQQEHTDRHLERVKVQAAESQSTIEKLNNELEEMKKIYLKKCAEVDELRNKVIDKQLEENIEMVEKKEKSFAVRIPVTEYRGVSGLPEPLEPVKLHTAKTAAVKGTFSPPESTWVYPCNSGPPYPVTGNIIPELNDHDDDRFQDAVGEPQLLCPVCNHTFLSTSDLITHVESHNLEKYCPVCSNLMDNVSQKEYENHVNECK